MDRKRITVDLPAPANVKPYYSEAELADEWGMKKNTLAVWRCYGKGPAYCKIGGRVRYRRADVEAWLQSNTQLQPAGAC